MPQTLVQNYMVHFIFFPLSVTYSNYEKFSFYHSLSFYLFFNPSVQNSRFWLPVQYSSPYHANSAHWVTQVNKFPFPLENLEEFKKSQSGQFWITYMSNLLM